MIKPLSLFHFNKINSNNGFAKKEVTQALITEVKQTENKINSNASNLQPEIRLQLFKAENEYRKFLNKKGKVTAEEYEDIKKNNPRIILKAIKNIPWTAEGGDLFITPAEAAKIIKSLDSYDSKDSVIISIGTSPSFITEGMKAKGKDIIFLPMSNANWCIGKSTIHEYFEYYPNLKLVGEYLKYKGITPEKLKNKSVTILDYSVTGRTIHIVERLLKEYCKIPEEKIYKEELLSLIGLSLGVMRNNTQKDREHELRNIKRDLYGQNIECASNVPHFSIYNDKLNKQHKNSISSSKKTKEELFKEFDEFSKPASRAYQLCVLYELDKLENRKDDN